MFEKIHRLTFIYLMLWGCDASATTLDVCQSCAFTNISDAVHAAANGDTIRVASGSYTGFENIPQFSNGATSVALEGGYRSDFSARDQETILDGINIQLSPWYIGSVSLDSFTFAHGGSVYVASTAASLAVSNCKFDVDNVAAISVVPYYPLPDYPWADRRQRASTSFSFINNDIIANPTAGAIDVYLIGNSPWVATTVIEGNTIHGANQQYASGINYYSSGVDDSVQVVNNHIYENTRGIVLQMTGTNGFVEISSNRIHDNTESAMRLLNSPSLAGHYLVHHNLFYNQPKFGVLFFSPGLSQFYNNVFYANQWVGLKLYGSTGHPTISNNIFSEHPQRSLEISGNETGWGSTQIVPAALRYNNFYNSTPASWFFHESLPPAYSYNNEIPGDYTGINQFAWAEGNFSESPHFQNPAAGNFSLAAESFCIDEGDPADDFVDEPLPNGGRINLGYNGNTAFAESTSPLVGVTNLLGSQADEEIQISLDLSQEQSAVWISAEYSSGSGWVAIPASALHGVAYKVGYKGGRVQTGPGRNLFWSGARAALDGLTRSDFKIRLTVRHGTRSTTVESAAFGVNFAVPTVVITTPAANQFMARTGSPFVAEARGFLVAPSSVRFEYKLLGSSNYSLLSSDSSAPYEANWSGVLLRAGGQYLLRATAFDSLGNPSYSMEIPVTACAETLGATSAAHANTGADAELSVTSGASCGWTASSTAEWITIITGAFGSGNGNVIYRVTTNQGAPRSGVINIGSTSFTVQQAGADCTFSANINGGSFEARGGQGTLVVDASRSDCSWALSGVPDWITGLEEIESAGDRTFNFTVSANTGAISRETTIGIAGQTLSIVQSAIPYVTITVNKVGSGKGAISAKNRQAGCGETCSSFSVRVRQGEQVRLESIVPKGSQFTGWQSGGCTGAGVCEFFATQDSTIVASYAALPPLLTASVSRLTFSRKRTRWDFVLQNRGTVPIRILGVGLSSRGAFEFKGIKAGTVVGVKQNKKTVTVSLKSTRITAASSSLIIVTDDPNRQAIEIPLQR